MNRVEQYNKQVMAASRKVAWHVMITDRGLLTCLILLVAFGFFGMYNVFWGQGETLKSINNGVWQLLQR